MRLSRGRSTPTRRAMWWRCPFGSPQRFLVVSRPTPRRVGSGLCSGGGSARRATGQAITLRCSVVVGLGSALALLVARVLADHHDAAVATDHLALVTDRLDTRLDLHERAFPASKKLVRLLTCSGRRSDLA